MVITLPWVICQLIIIIIINLEVNLLGLIIWFHLVLHCAITLAEQWTCICCIFFLPFSSNINYVGHLWLHVTNDTPALVCYNGTFILIQPLAARTTINVYVYRKDKLHGCDISMSTIDDGHSIEVQTHAGHLSWSPLICFCICDPVTFDLWPLTFWSKNHVTCIGYGHSLYQVWRLWDHSSWFELCCGATDRRTDTQTDADERFTPALRLAAMPING